MRTFAAILLVVALALPSSSVRAASAEDAYQQARLDYFALRGDEKRRTMRHHWESVLERLDKSVAALKGGPRRCEALFNAGRAWHEMSDVSYLRSDREEAIRRYGRLVESCPRSPLADDALFHTAALQRRFDEAAAARTVDRLLARYPKGDMAADARAMRKELPAAKPEKAQAVARKAEPVKRAPAREAPARETVVRKEEPKAAPAPATETVPTVAAKAPASPAAPQPPPGESNSAGEKRLPSAADILAALDAHGADANRPEDLALAEDLRRAALESQPAQQKPTQSAARPAESDLDRDRLARLEASTGGEIPLSLAAGLKVRRVVIDAGHGGKDTGAIGKRGTREKDLTLAISKRLARRLRDLGLEVLLTRDRDEFLELEERTRFANDHHADLFISVHINAAVNRKARGIETYTLNLNSDRYAMRLAARENASSSKSIGDLQFILADLATKANTDDSVRLARLVQGEMVGRLQKRWGATKVRDLGVKQALFFVLVGAKMPAILVETAFISNPDEELRLRSESYQEETARSIAEGVRRFIAEREAIARGGDVATSGVF